MNHSIDQMKEEISIKDHAIVKEHFQHHSVDKDKEILKNEITKIKKQLNSSNVIMENQRIEIVKLQRIIEEADAESTRQKNELSAVVPCFVFAVVLVVVIVVVLITGVA